MPVGEISRSKQPPRLFVVADIGGPRHYHLGDDAMLEANLEMFRRRVPDIQFVVTSRDPAWTSSRYDVESLRTPEVPPGTSDSWAREMADAADASGLWADWLGDEITQTLGGVDGLVVSGGGNLCASWPEKVLERVALMEYAQGLGLPVAILGQTLGPALNTSQRRLLAGPLQRSRWVGVRDESSAALALDLGVTPERLSRQLDDAFFLEPLAVEDGRAEQLRQDQRPWIVVTLDASFGSVERERSLTIIASQLDALADSLNAALIFVPHVGGSDVCDALADGVAGRALGARLRSPLLTLDLWQPREVRWLVEQAAMVVSTRYHPLVFAAAGGVVPVGIYTDDYTRTKLRGALAPAGLEGCCLSLPDTDRGAFLPLARELWHQRETVRERLVRLRSDAWPRELGRWDEICRALELSPDRTSPEPEPMEAPAREQPPAVARDSASSNATDGSAITVEQWRQYQQAGYLRLGRVLNDRQLAVLRERMDDIMLGRVRYPTLQAQLDTGGAYEDLPEALPGVPEATLAYRKVQGLESDPLVLDLIRHDLFREICARHYGKHASTSIFRVMLMNKPAGQGTYLPWHQDAGDVWKLDRDPLVTIWIALDPATKLNGCLEVIPGSHRLGLLSKNGSTISPEHARMHCPDEAIAYLEVEAGEAILIHNWLLHRSNINHTSMPRRALTTCYMDGRTLNTLTGTRFPIVFGEHEDAEAALPFLRVTMDENRQLRDMAAEAERHAKSLLEDNMLREQMRCEAERHVQSLLEDNQLREQMRCEAERHAMSLLEDNRLKEQMRCEAERYALSLEAELARIRTAKAPKRKIPRMPWARI